MTTVERARDLSKKPARILAVMQGGNPGWNDGALGSHNMPVEEYGAGNGKTLAVRLFERAGVTPADVDTAQIYDNEEEVGRGIHESEVPRHRIFLSHENAAATRVRI